MLNSLFIILREVLEASIIISILIAAMNKTSLKTSWIFIAVIIGGLGSLVMASHIIFISDSFEGVGQEVLNATMLFILAVLLTFFVFFYIRYRFLTPSIDRLLTIILIVIVSMAISREGGEIYIYVNGYVQSFAESLPLIIGASIGAGIGISSGAIVYYCLIYSPIHLKQIISSSVLALISAGMISESILYLMQADWLDSTQPLWNSSTIVSESSVTGQMLYALLAYEATPTGLQVTAYFVTIAVFSVLINRAFSLNRQALNEQSSEQNKSLNANRSVSL
ncbi:MAG: hypothetical protein COA74_06345 [Gammaproteobacteria bacterium]|nr:MAG: hypothetical protein COA74_06345 [Gammaproteobacteria bacterium]